jgi:hypothetical protein
MAQPLKIQSQKIIVLCRDAGGYLDRLSRFLGKQNQVTFVDVSGGVSELSFLPGKLRRWLKKYLIVRRARREIKAAGKVDALLVVNPSQLDQGLVNQAKSAATLTTAFLCDGIARLSMSVEQLSTFDKVYTFDGADARDYNLRKLNNYIYEERRDFETSSEYKAFVVMAGKDRVKTLGKIAQAFDRQGHSNYKFLVQSKPVADAYPGLVFFRERMDLEQVADYVRRSEILIDIVRPGHAGLSFRFFEALLYRKKIITNNPCVKDYDFFDPRNILVVDGEHPDIPEAFIVGDYVAPDDDTVEGYSMAAWANEVFAPWPAAPHAEAPQQAASA